MTVYVLSCCMVGFINWIFLRYATYGAAFSPQPVLVVQVFYEALGGCVVVDDGSVVLLEAVQDCHVHFHQRLVLPQVYWGPCVETHLLGHFLQQKNVLRLVWRSNIC